MCVGRTLHQYFAVASQKLDDKTASGDNKTKADRESERKERKKEEK
jgi:hypothetical protein